MDYKFLIFFCLHLVSSWWFDEEPSSSQDKMEESNSDEKERLSIVQFEIMTAEQKFLQEAKELLELSPLDECQRKVIDSLQQSCSTLSEEGVAKLSVQLLNCQSEVEGREVFPCTQDMSIALCTGPMSAHAWNAYHIISNRARSVCYTIRQTQFRQQTESVVNRLSQSTMYQLRALAQLADNQDEIRQSTLDSLDILKQEKEQLLTRHEELELYQEQLRQTMEGNLNKLAREKTMMDNAQQLIHNMTHAIEQQLELSRELLRQHDVQRKQHQLEVSDELGRMKTSVREVWSNIDNSTLRLLSVVQQLSVQYEDVQDRLNTINITVSHVLMLLDNIDGVVNTQLGWLVDHMGGAQDGLSVLVSIATHCVFLLVGCLVLLFLKAPWFSRLMLLVAVVTNLLLDMNTTHSLSLNQLTILMILTFIGDCALLYYRMYYQEPISVTPTSTNATPTSDHAASVSPKPLPPLSIVDLSDSELSDDIQYTATPTVSSAHFRQNHHGNSCVGVTRAGLQCRIASSPGSNYCFRHK